MYTLGRKMLIESTTARLIEQNDFTYQVNYSLSLFNYVLISRTFLLSHKVNWQVYFILSVLKSPNNFRNKYYLSKNYISYSDSKIYRQQSYRQFSQRIVARRRAAAKSRAGSARSRCATLPLCARVSEGARARLIWRNNTERGYCALDVVLIKCVGNWGICYCVILAQFKTIEILKRAFILTMISFLVICMMITMMICPSLDGFGNSFAFFPFVVSISK